MKKSKFSDEQIVTILAEGDRCETTVDKLCVKHGISSATYYQWRKKFRGLQTDDVKRLRELESENSLLKRLLAEREMDGHREAHRKKVQSTVERKDWMIELTNQGMSQRTACKLASIARSTATRKSTMPEDKPLREKINFLHFKYKRAGYRVIHEYLKREGININHKKMFRIWTEDGHTQPRRRKKKRAKGEGPMPFSALYKGHIWSLDFVADKTTTGLELRYLTVIDDFTRECIGIEVRRSMKAVDVINSLRRLMKRHGQPAWIRTDNGMEFAAQALQNWLSDRYVKSHFIAPGSPWQNGINERFNGTLRNEHLDMDQLYGLLDARVKAGMFRDYYNNERVHS